MTYKKKHLRITRCYLVEYIDDEENEIASEYCFGTKEDAIKTGERLVEEIKGEE